MDVAGGEGVSGAQGRRRMAGFASFSLQRVPLRRSVREHAYMRVIHPDDRALFLKSLIARESKARFWAIGAAIASWLAMVGVFGTVIHRPGTALAAEVMNGHGLEFVLVLAVIVFIQIGLPTILATEVYKTVLGRALIRAMNTFGKRRVCAACLYDIHSLQENGSERCPECGRAIRTLAREGEV